MDGDKRTRQVRRWTPTPPHHLHTTHWVEAGSFPPCTPPNFRRRSRHAGCSRRSSSVGLILPHPHFLVEVQGAALSHSTDMARGMGRCERLCEATRASERTRVHIVYSKARNCERRRR
eukprot:6196418-Pleurochrysis_carterae.AAC.7